MASPTQSLLFSTPQEEEEEEEHSCLQKESALMEVAALVTTVSDVHVEETGWLGSGGATRGRGEGRRRRNKKDFFLNLTNNLSCGRSSRGRDRCGRDRCGRGGSRSR